MALVNNPVMGINLRQNKNSKNAGYGKYYPEVDMQKTLTIRGFAQHLIDHGSKYKRGDIENMLSIATAVARLKSGTTTGDTEPPSGGDDDVVGGEG